MKKLFLLASTLISFYANVIISIVPDEESLSIINISQKIIERELSTKEAQHITGIRYIIEDYLKNGTITINKLRPLLRGYLVRKQKREELKPNHAPKELMPIKNMHEALLVPLTIQIIIESDLLSVKDKKTLIKALQERGVAQHYIDQLKIVEKYFLNKLPKDFYFKGLSTPIPNKKDNSSLHFLANLQEQEINSIRAITSYLSEPIHWDTQNQTGETPLHNAAGKKNIPFIKFLLEKGANITIRRHDGKTPLLKILASNLNLGVTYEKLPKLTNQIKGEERRILKELKTKQETQKLVTIIEHDGILHADAIPLLALLSGTTQDNSNLTQEVLILSANNNGWTPLHYAAAYHSEEIVRFFIQQGAEVNSLDNNGRTPLHVAAERGRTFNAQALVQEGLANPEIQDHSGRRPLDLVDSKIGQIFSAENNKAFLYYSSTLESLLLIEKVMRGTFEWGNLDPKKWWLAPWVDPWVLTIDFSDEIPTELSDEHTDDEFNE